MWSQPVVGGEIAREQAGPRICWSAVDMGGGDARRPAILSSCRIARGEVAAGEDWEWDDGIGGGGGRAWRWPVLERSAVVVGGRWGGGGGVGDGERRCETFSCEALDCTAVYCLLSTVRLPTDDCQ